MTISIDVRKKLGSFELQATFELPAGFTAIIGRSGSGKTALLNVISGLTRPESGHIVIAGQTLIDIANKVDIPAHKRRIGYVFQEARLFPHLTVRQNLTYGRWFAPQIGKSTSLDSVVELLGIDRLLSRNISRLSGGEKQRIAIGRALLTSPRLLLMDEPLSALDRERKEEIVPYLSRLQAETNIPIIYVTHLLDEVADLATSLIEMSEGRATKLDLP